VAGSLCFLRNTLGSLVAKTLTLTFVLLLSGCSSNPPAARPGVVAAGAVVGAALLFRAGANKESSDPPEDPGCFVRIEGDRRETICP
jgi:hypothetical protein